MFDNHSFRHLEGAFGLEGIVGTIGEGYSTFFIWISILHDSAGTYNVFYIKI